ncbi:MAG TPA: single-stranded DNA-binding protein [Bdellovibrionales bacterium]|nr:single-stranded DNA-binding protein [Bdellovibrionales bacterium]
MRSINRVFLVGRVGAKPELRKSKNGKDYAKFSIATNRSFKNGAGEYEERTDWHRIMVWGYDAQKCFDRLEKGSPVFVEGELNQFKIEEDNGKSQYMTTVTANEVSFPSLPIQSATAS